MNIFICEKQYTFSKDVGNNRAIRDSFNTLVRSIYDFDFSRWHKEGFWGENYKPYVLIHGNTVVANVSVNIICLDYNDTSYRHVQIGTVATHPDYRHQGLSKWLIEKVLEDYRDADEIYLYANDSVLEFYPKFGFTKATETEYIMSPKHNSSNNLWKKLNFNKENHKNLLLDCLEKGNFYSAFRQTNNQGLVLFYALGPFSDFFYYHPLWDLIAVVEEDDSTGYCYDIFGENDDSLNVILPTVFHRNVEQIHLGFVPKDKSLFEMQVFSQTDETLFVLKEHPAFVSSYKLQYPLLSHA